MNLDLYSNYWSVLESVIAIPTVIFSLYLYFKDPVKRWIFLGYLPVALIVLFDPEEKNILILKNKGTWGMPQGGIFTQDPTSVVEQTLRRELGIRSFNVEIRYSKPLKTLKIDDRYRTKRISLGTISPFTRSKGKGYVAYFVSADLNKIKSIIHPGYGISNVTVSTFNNAKNIFSKQKKYKRKNHLLLDVLKELEEYLQLKDNYSQN